MAAQGIAHVVAETSAHRAELARAVFALGYHAEIYGDYQELLAAKPRQGVIVAEDIAAQGGAAGLIDAMAALGFWCPIIATSTDVDIRRVVAAVRAGALDYLGWNLEPDSLRISLEDALLESDAGSAARRETVEAQNKLKKLTPRELQVLDHLVAGSSNKEIAQKMEISPRTVEIHRANVMSKLEANHPADAIRLRLAAGGQSVSLHAQVPDAIGLKRTPSE